MYIIPYSLFQCSNLLLFLTFLSNKAWLKQDQQIEILKNPQKIIPIIAICEIISPWIPQSVKNTAKHFWDLIFLENDELVTTSERRYFLDVIELRKMPEKNWKKKVYLMKSSKHIPLLLCLCYYEQCFVILIVFMDNLRANTVSIFEFFLHMSLQSDNQSFQTSDRCWLNIQIASMDLRITSTANKD